MAKPMLVTLPCVLLLLDFWPLKRVAWSKLKVADSEAVSGRSAANDWQLLREKIPLFLVYRRFLPSLPISRNCKAAAAPSSHFKMCRCITGLKTIPVAYVEYLCKIFWPSKLAIFYPLPAKNSRCAKPPLPLALLIFISLAAGLWMRTRPYLLTGWLWFLGMLVPVIGLVQVGSTAGRRPFTLYAVRSEFFSPSPSLFATGAARFKIPKSVARRNRRFHPRRLRRCDGKPASLLAKQRNTFSPALAVTTDNDVARNDLGVALEQQGRFAEAAVQYRAATKLEPGRYQGHYNLAKVLDRLGRPAEALAEHREAVRLGRTCNFCIIALGLTLVSAGRTDEALKEFADRREARSALSLAAR